MRPPWLQARRCEIDGCGARSWRYCRVCGRWACRGHRFGAGWWWRCPSCTADELAAVMRLERAMELDALILRCRRCGTPMHGVWWSGVLVQRPACDCPPPH